VRACAIPSPYDDGRNINASWDTVWFCRSSVSGTAWYVEEAIPFKQLRFPQQNDQRGASTYSG
jgi:hypothetical protein